VVSTCGGCTYLHGVEAGAALLTTEPDWHAERLRWHLAGPGPGRRPGRPV